MDITELHAKIKSLPASPRTTPEERAALERQLAELQPENQRREDDASNCGMS